MTELNRPRGGTLSGRADRAQSCFGGTCSSQLSQILSRVSVRVQEVKNAAPTDVPPQRSLHLAPCSLIDTSRHDPVWKCHCLLFKRLGYVRSCVSFDQSNSVRVLHRIPGQ